MPAVQSEPWLWAVKWLGIQRRWLGVWAPAAVEALSRSSAVAQPGRRGMTSVCMALLLSFRVLLATVTSVDGGRGSVDHLVGGCVTGVGAGRAEPLRPRVVAVGLVPAGRDGRGARLGRAITS